MCLSAFSVLMDACVRTPDTFLYAILTQEFIFSKVFYWEYHSVVIPV